MEKVEVICKDCGCTYTVSKRTVDSHKKDPDFHWRCTSCRNKYFSKKMKEYYNSLSEEEKAARDAKAKANLSNYMNNLSGEELEKYKEKHIQGQKNRWAKIPKNERINYLKEMRNGYDNWWNNMSADERKKFGDKVREGQFNMDTNKRNEMLKHRGESRKKAWDKLSEDERKLFTISAHIKSHEWWNGLSEEERVERLDKLHNDAERWRNGLTNEERELRNKLLHDSLQLYWDNLPEEIKTKRAEYLNNKKDEWWENLPDTEKDRWKLLGKNLSKHQQDWWNNLPDTEKERQSLIHKQWWDNLPNESKESFVRKRILAANGHNKFHQKFEKSFMESELVNYFYFRNEHVLTNNGRRHSWDYGIFDQDGELVAVVDLDGAYYHADICDYDGVHSKLEYDMRRGLSVKGDVIICIINENMFDATFDIMVKSLMIKYDDYVNKTFDMLRAMPFPYPYYTDKELLDSFNKLQTLDPNSKYYNDISINNRMGDRMIYHFHHSIWHNKVNDKISPYDAWCNDDMLMDMIKDKYIYHPYINANKLLIGFNVYNKAQKVDILSAAKAKIIISKYLSEYDTIFNPLNDYSEIMLGAISLGKKYIFNDKSETRLLESKRMVEFLNKYKIKTNIEFRNNHDGEYPCLFTFITCIDINQSDNLIYEYLERYKCKRYVFIVDHTDKYKSNIEDLILDIDDLSEYKFIIIIDK